MAQAGSSGGLGFFVGPPLAASRKILSWRTVEMARRKRRPYMQDPGYAQEPSSELLLGGRRRTEALDQPGTNGHGAAPQEASG